MSTVLRGLRSFGSFWADFILGDDWTVALAVGLALLATWGLVAAGIPAWWLLPAVVVVMTLVSLRRSQSRPTPSG